MSRRSTPGGAVTLLLGIAGLATAAVLVPRYRRDLAAARERLAGLDRRRVDTWYGEVEYCRTGSPAGADHRPVLVSHGIFHGCDGGLEAVEDLVGDRPVIAPSRFGYLGSTMPIDASPALQADAFVALLDRLDVETVDVIGISAGTGAAVQTALRHPERVAHLVVSSGNWPGSPTAEAPPKWAKAFYSDPAMWLMKVAAPPAYQRLMGVPAGFPTNEAEAAEIERLSTSIFPLSERVRGAVFDAYISNPEIIEYPFERLDVPTLIVHAEDDSLASHDAAVEAFTRISGATLVSLESGGHLQLGQRDRVRSELATFLG